VIADRINKDIRIKCTVNIIFSKGILGMAFSSLSNGIPTFFENLYAQNKIDENVFSFWFNR
jgi:hypothetical protein